jgi:hypothetical protein
VLAALKAARPERHQKGHKLSKDERAKRREAWTASMAKSLGVKPSAVTSAVRALVKQRLDSLVEEGWLTPDQAAKRVDKLGVNYLRRGVR